MSPLEGLRRLDAASTAEEGGPELRALLIRLIEGGGMVERIRSGVEKLDKVQRNRLAKLGVRVGTLDVFLPTMLRPSALGAWRELAAVDAGKGAAMEFDPAMPPTLPVSGKRQPLGYRRAGKQWLRLDLAEKLLREAHAARLAAGKRSFALDRARAISMGLTTQGYSRLLQMGGFQAILPKALPDGALGPPAPLTWRWRPPRRQGERGQRAPAPANSAFAVLAELVR